MGLAWVAKATVAQVLIRASPLIFQNKTLPVPLASSLIFSADAYVSRRNKLQKAVPF
jgi:hypothetical protein